MARGQQRAVRNMAWLLDTTNSMVGCRSVAALLDLAYDAIRAGLGYDRVGLLLVDRARGALVGHIGTDALGRKFYPTKRITPLVEGGYDTRMLTDPRMQASGPGFIYIDDASREVPPEAQYRLDGHPGQGLRVALRRAETVLGVIAVDNLTSGRPIIPDDAPPLVAFANALAAAVESVAALEDRTRRIDTLGADLRQRVEQLAWLQEASARMALLHDFDTVLDSICTLVCAGLGYDRLGLFLLEPGREGELLETEVRGIDEQGRLWRFPEEFLAPPLAFRPDDPSFASQSPDVYHLLQGHSSYYCSDSWAITPPEARDRLSGEVHEQIVVAMRQDGVLLGYISVDNLLSRRPITEADAVPLAAFAAHAALAISRARLWAAHEAQGKSLARRVAELEWLREISRQVNAARSLEAVLDLVYDGIRTGLGYDRVGIDLLDHEAGTFVEYLGTDATGHKTRPTNRVASLGQQSPLWTLPSVAALIGGAEFYYTADGYAAWPAELRFVLDGEPRQLLQVALRSDDVVTGIISVDNLLTGHPVTEEDAGPLLALAHQVSTAIENARLHERERAERARLEVAALTDHLTDVGNHRAFYEEFRRETARAQRQGEHLALALLDVDEFKVINDSQGHSQGDRVLTALGEVLRGSRTEDRAFRLGGDEFALILPATTEGDAIGVVERLRQKALSVLGGATLSIGVAGTRTGESDLDSLREEADAALYEAKRRGRNRVVSFADLRESSGVTAPAKAEAVRRLLAEGRLGAVFQPIWDLERGTLLGYEALSRPAADYGLSGPREAFEIAAQIGRAPDLDALCRQTILSQAASLPPDSLLFLNVAQATLEHAALAGTSLVQAVEAAGLSPNRVVLDVTECAGARTMAVVHEALRLQSLGFRLALDEAGADNLGLELLSQLPWDFVKIDRTLVARAMHDTTARAVLAALLAYALHANIYVIAGGIEAAALLEFVRGAGHPVDAVQGRIHGVQGNLIGRPNAGIERTMPPALRKMSD